MNIRQFCGQPHLSSWLAIPLTCLLLPAQDVGKEAQEAQRKRLSEEPISAEAQAVPAAKISAVKPDLDPQEERTYPPDERHVTNAIRVEPTDDEPNFVSTVDEEAIDDSNRVMRLDGNPYRLSFTNGDYEPPMGIDPDLRKALIASPSGKTYGFVMIHGRIVPSKFKTLQDLGIKFLGAHTWQSYKAQIPISSLGRLAQLPMVHWVGYARPQQKLDKVLAEALETAADDQEIDIWVNFFESDMGPAAEKVVVGEARKLSERADELPLEYTIPHGPFQNALEDLGFEFTFYSDSIYAMRGKATKAEILKIRDLNFVVSVEMQHGVGSVDHDQSLAMVSIDRVRASYPGVSVPLGWTDTGIDSSPWHQDFYSQNFRGWDTTGVGVFSDGHGHGTHTGGTIFGQGRADKRYKGAAPSLGLGASNDRIYVGRLMNNAGSIIGSPQSLWNVFKVSTTSGGITTPKRSIVSESWSYKSSSGYYGTETLSRDLDNVIHSYQQTYVRSSGNTGSTSGSWCASPSVAKNALTIGNVIDWFSSTLKPGQTSTSVRYKTRDGRRKPEIVAAGQSLSSTKLNTSTSYSTKSGTSMSTPTVAGLLAGVVDRNTSFYKYKPSGLRALAIASAKYGSGSLGICYDSSYKTGFGLVNAYKMHYATSRSKYTNVTGSLTWPSNLSTFDVAISSSCQALKVVMCWTETAASSSATKARKNALRLYADVPPYTSGATGNYSMSNSQDTVIFTCTWASALKGKTVRFKVHAYTQLLGSRQNWAVCILQYLKPLTSSSPTLSQTVDKTAVRPGQSVVLTSTLTAQSGQDEFNNGRIYYSSPTSWTMTRIERTTADGILQSYTGTTHPSYPYPRLTTGTSGGMTVGQGSSRRIKFTMRAPTSIGYDYLYTRATHHGSSVSTLSNSSRVCVDNQAPNAIANLKSTTHTAGGWSNKTTLTHTWTKATDVGCAGIKRLPYRVTIGSPGTPTTSSTAKTAATISDSRTVGNTSSGYYFAIRAQDKVDYLGLTRSAGPYKIDTTKPTATSLTINNGASKTASLSVSVKASGTDSYSGIQYMQYSANASSWTGHYAYQTTARTINLSTIPGGSTAEGTKLLYVRLRDRAGNYSSPRMTGITYMKPPVISTSTYPSREAVTHAFFRFTGTGFTETTRVKFGAINISTKWTNLHENWWAGGSFRVLGDTVIYVYPPQGLTPGNYNVQTYNGLSYSNAKAVAIIKNAGHVLQSSRVLTAGASQTIMVTNGGLKPTVTRQVIIISFSKVPSVFLPTFKFDLGNNFTMMIQLPQLGFDGNGVSKIGGLSPKNMKGLTLYFQAAYLDFTKNAVWPLPVSVPLWTTVYK